MIGQKRANRFVAMALTIVLGAAIPIAPASGTDSNLRTGGTVPTLAPLVREVTPAVVNIAVHGKIRQDNPLYRDPLFREFFDVPKQLEKEINATGSGVIVDAQKGYVLTNNHVVDQVSCRSDQDQRRPDVFGQGGRARSRHRHCGVANSISRWIEGDRLRRQRRA